MSSTPMSADAATESSGTVGVPMAFEVTTLPVADVDRAKAFYQRLGWRLDIDFKPTETLTWRSVHPTGLGGFDPVRGGHDDDDAGLAQGLLLIVEDIETARDDLISRGVEVSEIWHTVPGKGQEPGLDPERRSYFSRATSRIPTATPGSCRRSRSGSRAGCDRWTLLILHSSCMKRPSTTVRSRRSPPARLVGLVRGLHGRS